MGKRGKYYPILGSSLDKTRKMGSRLPMGRRASRKKEQLAGNKCTSPWKWVSGSSDQDQGPQVDLYFLKKS